jgi:hypothetical protein
MSPLGVGFMAATSMKLAGKRTAPWERAMVTTWSSSGWRRVSRTSRGELGEFVEEEHAVVGEGDLAGARDHPAADDRGGGGGVVGRADGAGGDEALARREEAGGGVDAGDLDGFVGRERRENAGEGLGHHGFAGAGGPEHEMLCEPLGGDYDGAFDGFLPADIGEVDGGSEAASRPASRAWGRGAGSRCPVSRPTTSESVRTP